MQRTKTFANDLQHFRSMFRIKRN